MGQAIARIGRLGRSRAASRGTFFLAGESLRPVDPACIPLLKRAKGGAIALRYRLARA